MCIRDRFKEGILGFKDILKKLKEERNTITATIQNLNELRILREEFRELQFSDGYITDDFKSHLALKNNPILKSEKLCLSVKAKGHWYYVQALKHFLLRDFKTALKVSATYVDFLEENSELFPVSSRLPAISNYIYFAARIKNKNSFDKGINILKKISELPNIDLILSLIHI